MIVGIDFDNTVICYDRIFYIEALKRQLIPAHLSPLKEHVRDYLRESKQEDLWTELQGYVYGRAIVEAMPFPAVKEFLQQCREHGIKTFIVSHKTKFPYSGVKYDLHLAAYDWLRAHQFLDTSSTGLSQADLIFAETKANKLVCIRELGCTHFIDDLPEFLNEPDFPQGVERILFKPENSASDNGSSKHLISKFVHLSSWNTAFELICQGKGLLGASCL